MVSPRSPPHSPPQPLRLAQDSTHSSPRPDSVVGLPDPRQRDQDVHLAQSMVQNSAARTRSNTMLERGELLTPQRGHSGGQSGSSGQHHGSGAGHGGSRRRPSVGATNVMDHLADDLEIQAQQDSREEQRLYESAEASSPTNRSSLGRMGGQRYTSMHTPGSMQQSAAAARLYRHHHRNLSDSSIDSQGGAFIDHRRQPHSLSLQTGLTPRPGARSGDGHSGGGAGYSMSMGTALRRGSGGNDEHGIDDFSLGAPSHLYRRQNSDQRASASPISPSHPDIDSEGNAPGVSHISSRTARQQPLTSQDLDEQVFSDDDPHSPRPHLDRHASQKSYTSLRSRNDRDRDVNDFSHELSRRGSFMGKPEDDICFPAHGAAAEVDLLDAGDYMDGGHHQAHDLHGVAGVLPNFPFPFDFSALEEYAEKEKEGLPIPGARKRGMMAAAAAASQGDRLGTSPPGYGTSFGSMGGRGAAFSSGSEGEQPRRLGRNRKLSQSVGPGRFRRKFLDTETPLLGDSNLFGGRRGSAGEGGRGNGYGTGDGPVSAMGGARPYRFSFYSNALPSTIHARSLAEIPADGQTFEELFVGRHDAPYDESFPAPATDGVKVSAFSPPSGTATGTHTPNGTDPGHPSSKGGVSNLSGARPAGIPHSEARARAEKARSGLMRTDVDAEANTWWLDVLCPTDAEMKVLSKVFGIHPLTTEDVQMEETREKIELFRNYYFVCFRSFEQDPHSPTYLQPLNMYIIVFREGTLSFHFRGTPHPQNVRRRIKQLKDYINVTSDWISYALIDDITDVFGPLIQNIEYEVDSIDELVLILKEAEQSDMLRRIGTCRKKVMGLLRLMGNKADVVKGLSKRCNENWSVAPKSDIGLYLSDIQDHIQTSTQNLTHYEKILSRSHSNYLAQISIEMTDANNQINDVLSKLTALGTVLIPMNLITGLWGMNVNVPGQGVENLHWFFSIIGCLGAIAIGGAWLTYKVFVRPGQN